MDVEQLKQDVREGRVDVDRLVELMATLQRQLTEAHQRIRELEGKLGARADKLEQPFSLKAEEKRQEARGSYSLVTAAPVQTPTGQFVPVAGTNNESERTLRGPAEARKTGHTNKTPRGARRQTVLTSVLESLRLQLSDFTLSSLVEEAGRWTSRRRSCFSDLMQKLKLARPEKSILKTLLPVPAG